MEPKRPADSNDANPNPLRQPRLEDDNHYDTPNLNEKDMEAIKDSLKVSFTSDYQQLNAQALRLLFYEVTNDAALGKRAGIKLTDVNSFVSLAMANVVLGEDCRKAIVEHDPRDLLRNRLSTLAIAGLS